MGRYKKETNRLTVKYINSDTDDVVFEINDTNWMDVGKLLTDHHVSELILKKNDITPPDNLMVIVVGEYNLIE